jgi:hypothetical protein
LRPLSSPVHLLFVLFTRFEQSQPVAKKDPLYAAQLYGWTGRKSSSGFSDMPRPALGVFASLDRF